MSEPPEVPPELNVSVERYAVYRCYSESGQLLYVGESGELGKRLASHAQKLWFTQVRGITLEWHADELSALNAERRAIHVEHPKHNTQHRHSKTIRKPKTRGRSSRRRPAAQGQRRTWPETKAEALEILGAHPGISGSELGRRLGLTDARGRQIARQLAKDALPGPADQPEESQ